MFKSLLAAAAVLAVAVPAFADVSAEFSYPGGWQATTFRHDDGSSSTRILAPNWRDGTSPVVTVYSPQATAEHPGYAFSAWIRSHSATIVDFGKPTAVRVGDKSVQVVDVISRASNGVSVVARWFMVFDGAYTAYVLAVGSNERELRRYQEEVSLVVKSVRFVESTPRPHHDWRDAAGHAAYALEH
jgi:hypothetical protein